MKNFNKYVAIAMHVQHDYMDDEMYCYRISDSWIQSYPSFPAKVIPQNSFPCSFQ